MSCECVCEINIISLLGLHNMYNVYGYATPSRKKEIFILNFTVPLLTNLRYTHTYMDAHIPVHVICGYVLENGCDVC